MPTTSIPIPSSVSPITNLKDFIDKGREDMLSFLAGIGGTYIYWTVFPTNDPLTLKQSEGERRVAEMVDQIDCARIDLALDSINGGSFLPSAINRAPQQGTPHGTWTEQSFLLAHNQKLKTNGTNQIPADTWKGL